MAPRARPNYYVLGCMVAWVWASCRGEKVSWSSAHRGRRRLLLFSQHQRVVSLRPEEARNVRGKRDTLGVGET